jgi:hypothetical protein
VDEECGPKGNIMVEPLGVTPCVHGLRGGDLENEWAWLNSDRMVCDVDPGLSPAFSSDPAKTCPTFEL